MNLQCEPHKKGENRKYSYSWLIEKSGRKTNSHNCCFNEGKRSMVRVRYHWSPLFANCVPSFLFRRKEQNKIIGKGQNTQKKKFLWHTRGFPGKRNRPTRGGGRKKMASRDTPHGLVSAQIGGNLQIKIFATFLACKPRNRGQLDPRANNSSFLLEFTLKRLFFLLSQLWPLLVAKL